MKKVERQGLGVAQSKTGGRKPATAARVLVVGYFERGNLGDNAMRDGLILFLRADRPGAEIRSLSLPAWNGAGVRESPTLVRSLWWADAVILAGGSHFHDRYGRRSFRILATHWLMFGAARLLRASVGYAAVGVGPLDTLLGRWLARRLLTISAVTLVRDRLSARTVERLGSERSVVLGFDSASLLRAPERQRGGVARIGISITPYFSVFEKDAARDRLAAHSLAATIGDRGSRQQLAVDVFPFNRRGFASDVQQSELLMDALGEHVSVEVHACAGTRETLRDLSGLAGLIATRYHAALLGYLAGVPMILVAYDEKCTALAEEISLPSHAVLRPQDLLSTQTIGTALAQMLEDPGSFQADLPQPEAAERAAGGLRDFTVLLLGERSYARTMS